MAIDMKEPLLAIILFVVFKYFAELQITERLQNCLQRLRKRSTVISEVEELCLNFLGENNM